MTEPPSKLTERKKDRPDDYCIPCCACAPRDNDTVQVDMKWCSIQRGPQCMPEAIIVMSSWLIGAQDSDFQSQFLSSYSGSVTNSKTLLLIYFLFGCPHQKNAPFKQKLSCMDSNLEKPCQTACCHTLNWSLQDSWSSGPS